MINTRIKKKVQEYRRIHDKTRKGINSNAKRTIKSWLSEDSSLTPESMINYFDFSVQKDILSCGFYMSVESEDFTYLYDAIYTYSRLRFLRLEYDYNRDNNLDYERYNNNFQYVIDARITNDNALIEKLLERYIKIPTQCDWYSKSFANIIWGIELNNSKMIREGTIQIKKLLKQKLPSYLKYYINMLRCITEEDYTEFNNSLYGAMTTYTKYKSHQNGYRHSTDIIRYVPIDVYGLLKIGEKYLGEKFFTHIAKVDSIIWYQDFIDILKKNNKGKNFIVFTEEAAFFNKLLDEIG